MIKGYTQGLGLRQGEKKREQSAADCKLKFPTCKISVPCQNNPFSESQQTNKEHWHGTKET